MLAHTSALFNWSFVWIGVPLALIYFVDDDVVKANACEALNYGLVGLIVSTVIFVGCYCTLGLGMLLLIPMIPLFVVLALLPVVGICKVAMDERSTFIYPLVPRMIRYKNVPQIH
jgi:uncharacterized Tic20 family protein